MKFLPLILWLAGCTGARSIAPPAPLNGAMLRAPIPMLATPNSELRTPLPTVTHLAWSYTNRTCSADLQFEVEQSTNLIDWTPAGKSYGLSLSVTSYTDHAFYRVKTLVP